MGDNLQPEKQSRVHETFGKLEITDPDHEKVTTLADLLRENAVKDLERSAIEDPVEAANTWKDSAVKLLQKIAQTENVALDATAVASVGALGYGIIRTLQGDTSMLYTSAWGTGVWYLVFGRNGFKNALSGISQKLASHEEIPISSSWEWLKSKFEQTPKKKNEYE